MYRNVKLKVVLCVTLALAEREVEGWAASPNPYAQLDYLLMVRAVDMKPGGKLNTTNYAVSRLFDLI